MKFHMPWQHYRDERDYWLKRAADLWAENRRLRQSMPRGTGIITMPDVDTTHITLEDMAPGGLPAPGQVTTVRAWLRVSDDALKEGPPTPWHKPLDEEAR